MEGQPRLWTSTLFPPNPNAAMNFNFSEGGLQDLAFKNNGLYAVAVHDGDIFLTPEPSILVLLAVSLIAGLMTSRPTKRLLASAIS